MAVDLMGSMVLNMDTWGKSILKLMPGRGEGDPFSAEQWAAVTKLLQDQVVGQGPNETPTSKGIVQVPQVRLLRAFLRRCNDPDAEAADAFALVVRFGYNQRMPRTPAVFVAKERWRLKFKAVAASEDV